MNNVYGQCSRCGGSLTTDHVCPDQFQSVLAKKAASLNNQPISNLVAEIAQYIADQCMEDVTGFDTHMAQLIVNKVEPVIRAKTEKELLPTLRDEAEEIVRRYHLAIISDETALEEILNILNKP